MTDSFYELLGLEQGLASWRLSRHVYRVAEEVTETYGGTSKVPPVFKLAVETLATPGRRKTYDSLLAYAASKRALDPDRHLERFVTEHALHFRFEDVGSGFVRVVNTGIPEPPNPVPPEPTSTPPAASTHPVDEYGRVHGRIPPLSLGVKVFEIDFGDDCYLEAYSWLGDRAVTQWAQHTRTGLNRFAFTDFLSPFYGDDSASVGERHFVMLMRDVETHETYDVLTYNAEASNAGPKFVSCGIWDLFPWWTKYYLETMNPLPPSKAAYLWERDNPERPMPPRTFFGTDGWAPITTHALLTFIEESVYWSTCYRSGWQLPAEEARRFAEESVGAVCEHLVPFTRRQRKKLGIPHRTRGTEVVR